MIGSSRAFTCFLLLATCFSFVPAEKLKFCTVDGRGGFKKAARYCPSLETPDSQVECVVGIDRMDCLRKISKGTADFAILTAEDLVSAENAGIDVLITTEVRFTDDDFEYEVVAVVSKKSGIKSRYDLHDKRLCHPGYGYETHWTRILSNFLESSVIPQNCYENLTLTENRISSSSKFLKSACKAGPWVNDPALDYKLKAKYPNLCALCGSPSTCTTKDKYWGRRGPLFCLTDGMGDISWSRLDDVQMHFGIESKHQMADPSEYNLLCREDHVMPINSTKPCVWVVRPWPVVASRSATAERVQNFVSSLGHNMTEGWKTAFLDLIETYHITIHNVKPIQSLEGFLEKATGFLSANSFTGCHPPRTIRVCTTSIVENSKCGWIREAAAVYGIEPDIDCVKADNTTHCMQALNDNAADVVMVPPDLVHQAKSEYNLKTLFYETVNDEDKYIVVPIIRKDATNIKKIKDLRGKRACFPSYDGIAWNSVIYTLKNRSLINKCPYGEAMAEFFGESCVPNLPKGLPTSLKSSTCKNEEYSGDYGALNCLNEGNGDVAFVSVNSFNRYINDLKMNRKLSHELEVLCEDMENVDYCHLSWSPIGQGMVNKNHTDLWYKDALDVFMQLDNMYGKNYKTVTRPVTLFDLFNKKSNILFHDVTVRINNSPKSRSLDDMMREYEVILDHLGECLEFGSSSASLLDSSALFNAAMMFLVLLCHLVG